MTHYNPQNFLSRATVKGFSSLHPMCTCPFGFSFLFLPAHICGWQMLKMTDVKNSADKGRRRGGIGGRGEESNLSFCVGHSLSAQSDTYLICLYWILFCCLEPVLQLPKITLYINFVLHSVCNSIWFCFVSTFEQYSLSSHIQVIDNNVKLH